MPLPDPLFEHRSYRELLNEALARVPAHTPEWNNLSDSDPGVTLLQLFAFMAESIGYRANLIPERNRQKFLRLLGIPLRPAAAAEGLVSFSNARGPLETLPAGQELFAGKVPFHTENGLDVLPIEARLYYKAPLPKERQQEVDKLYRRLHDLPKGQLPAYYESRTFTTPASGVTLPAIELGHRAEGGEENPATLDGALWLALLAHTKESLETARQAIAGRVLTLGLLPALDQEGSVLRPGASTGTGTAPRGVSDQDAAEADSSLLFEIPDTSNEKPYYRRLAARTDGAVPHRPGLVELPLPPADQLNTWSSFGPLEEGRGAFPPSLEENADTERLMTWIRIRLPKKASGGAGLHLRLSWVGINAARVVQRARVESESLPRGTGAPDQTARLVRTPVLPDSVRLSVDGEIWRRVDELALAGPEVPPRSPRLASEALAPPTRESRVFTVDRESGEIRFGDGHRGARPPRGATVTASYDYGGGRQGMVGIGTITKAPRLRNGLKVSNPVPTWGGDEAESVAVAEKTIPAQLRHRDRLVSAEDFADITWRTPGVDLGRVEVLPLVHPDPTLRGVDAEGVVTVLVIPRHDPLRPRAPAPDQLFLETVGRYLEPRRLLTTEVHVRGPEYIDLWVTVGLDVVPGRDAAPVLEQAHRAVERFLSPLEGGFEGRGWPLGKAVEAAEISAAITRVEGVAKVEGVRLGPADGADLNTPLALHGLQLPRLTDAAVELGNPPSLDELRHAPDPGGEASKAVPIPVLLEEC